MNKYKNFSNSLKKLNFIKVDPLYNSYLYLKFFSRLLSCGRKHKLERILYRVFTNISSSLKIPFIFLINPIFKQSFLPLDFVKRKKGRRVYLVPVPVKYSRLYAVVLGHIAVSLHKKKTVSSKVSVFTSFFHASFFGKTNFFISKRKALIQQVIDNRAFKHFRWR
jgi:ribosomal protein S7